MLSLAVDDGGGKAGRQGGRGLLLHQLQLQLGAIASTLAAAAGRREGAGEVEGEEAQEV